MSEDEFAVDSVERQQAEQARRRVDELFRALIENASDVVTIVDAEGVIRYASPSVERVLGYKPVELIGTNMVELLHPEDVPKTIATMQAATPTGGPEILHVRTRHRDGSLRMMEGIAKVLDTPSVTGIVINYRDITERKRSEEALRHSHDLLNVTGQIAQVGGWELNLESQTLSWTEEVYRIYEVDPATRPNVAEAINFYAPESQPIISAAIQAGIDSGTPWDLELHLITAKGRRIEVRVQGAAERRNNKTVRLYGAFQDITARKQAEDELRQKKRTLRSTQ